VLGACVPILSLPGRNTPLGPPCPTSPAHWLAALGGGGHHPISGCPGTWLTPSMCAIPSHVLRLGRTDDLPCPICDLWLWGPSALCSPGAARAQDGVSPCPSRTGHAPCCPQPLWYSPVPALCTYSSYLLPKGGEGCPPTLPAMNPLLFHGHHPTLCPVQPLTSEGLCHPWTPGRS